MKKYIGTKILNAKPMTRLAYNIYRGWQLPADENGEDDGYLVEYHDGYTSWSPADAFEEAYRPCDAMTFGLAIEALKKGKRVARAGWNGKGMWLALVEGYDYNPDKGRGTAYALGCQKLPWIGMKTADGCFVPWLASQTDVLAEDWQIVE